MKAAESGEPNAMMTYGAMFLEGRALTRDAVQVCLGSRGYGAMFLGGRAPTRDAVPSQHTLHNK